MSSAVFQRPQAKIPVFFWGGTEQLLTSNGEPVMTGEQRQNTTGTPIEGSKGSQQEV